jgi:fermentation-respiration switch protein FrsA (DUF1100 family)
MNRPGVAAIDLGMTVTTLPRPPARVEFDAEGVTIVGHLHLPPNAAARALPAAVVAGPSPSVKEQIADRYAVRLAAAGYTALTFDPRNFGESGGSPRQREDPPGKLVDLRAAVSFLATHPAVDGDRIAAVGICAGAGYALKLAAFDRRVKAFAGIAGFYPSPDLLRGQMGADAYRERLEQLAEVLQRQDQGAATEYIRHVARDGEPAFMTGQEPYEFYGTGRARAAGYRNSITVDTGLALLTVDNAVGADFLGPTPGLIVHSDVDRYATPERAQEIFDRLTGPKRLVWLQVGNHIDLYDVEPHVQAAVDATVEFLAEHV